MKKIAVALVLVFSLAVSLALGGQLMYVAKANPISTPVVPTTQISYPITSIGGYVNSTVEFEIYVNTFIDSPALNSISYSLDGQPSVTLEDLKITNHNDYGPDKIDFKTYTANVILKDLSEGNHTLVASAIGMSDSQSFIVNSYYHITALSVISPNSPIYSNTVPVPLTFYSNGEIKNAHYYLYRGHESVSEKSVTGNMTLDNLSDGSYDLYLYVTTEYGQDSKAIHFYVIGNYTIIAVAIVLLVVFTATILLVYFKKIKPKKLTT
jgi:hypothetical protein